MTLSNLDKEIHFLHERGNKLAWFSAIQSIGTAALVIATTYLTDALGWRWWYGVFAIVNGAILFASFLLVPESRYVRPTDAFEGAVHIHHGNDDRIMRVTTQHGVVLDLARFKARTLKDDLKIFHGPADWKAALDCWKQMLQCLLFPNMLWVVLMQSCVLGVYVVMVTEFAGILVAPPNNFAFTSLGYVQGGQIIVSIIMVPVLGYGSDLLVRILAKRSGGVAEPEHRLIPMLLPAIIVVISCVFFGLGGAYPAKWSAWSIIISFNAEYFGFIGIVLIGFTYALDSYGERAAPLLVLICTVRGLVSFGISYGVTNFVESKGYDGALNICAIIVGVLSALGFPVYFFGKRIRAATAPWATDNKDLNLD